MELVGIRMIRRVVFEEMDKMKVDVGVLGDAKEKGRGYEMVNDYTHFYSGFQ